MTSENFEEIFQLIKDDITKENAQMRELIPPRPVAYPEVNLGTPRAWENQLGVCKPPPAGTGQSPIGGRGAKHPENFDDLLVKITFLKLNMPFYET